MENDPCGQVVARMSHVPDASLVYPNPGRLATCLSHARSFHDFTSRRGRAFKAKPAAENAATVTDATANQRKA